MEFFLESFSSKLSTCKALSSDDAVTAAAVTLDFFGGTITVAVTFALGGDGGGGGTTPKGLVKGIAATIMGS